MRFEGYPDDHARQLQRVFEGASWGRVVAQGMVEEARRKLVVPARPVNVFKLPVQQLQRMNEATVRGLIAEGERDEERLLAVLGTWPQQWPEDIPVELSFLGVNLGFACDMQPRCVYCNQQPVAQRMSVRDWLRVLRREIPPGPEGPYIFLTGGEPLMLGEALWGREGLVRGVTGAGAACNLNTNGLTLTPEVALGLVSSGLSRLHLSLDTHRASVQDEICQEPGRWAQILEALHNLQIAKALLGVEHPVVHINCVLTRLNAEDFPAFLRFLLARKPLVKEAVSRDLDVHLIPVGGEQNAHLRLSVEGYERFFSETWAEAERAWQEYQEAREVPADKRGPLEAKVPYLSPYHRVRQSGDLHTWAERAAAGFPAALSLTARCYVAPTQAFLLPDGAQYWCGGHSTSRPEPVGSVLQASVAENLRAGIGQLRHLPGPYCRSCAGATQAINQSVEASLRDLIRQWLNPAEETTEDAEMQSPAFE